MHLRHLIVLIINARNSATPALLKVSVSVVGIERNATASRQRRLIGQIKLTRIHVASLFLPGVRVKRNRKASLYDVERSGTRHLRRTMTAKLVSLSRRMCWSR